MADTGTSLMLAEFESSGETLAAATKLKEAGYTQFDSHSPFPIHGMDAAMGLPDSKLGWIVFPIGLCGTSGAFLMMHWMNNIDYPLVIGGKPPTWQSIPSMVPIMFELTVLLSAFATVLGMFALNKLPRHHHPIFNSDRFKGMTDDKFFISVESSDPKWNLDKTKKLLESFKPSHLELIHDDDEGGADFEKAAAEGHH